MRKATAAAANGGSAALSRKAAHPRTNQKGDRRIGDASDGGNRRSFFELH
jgi:hypothetical protein